MPIEHHWEEHGLHTCYIGRVTGRDLIEAALKISGDERFDNLRYVIGDWSACTESRVTEEDVEELAAYISAMALSNPDIANLTVMKEDPDSPAFVNLYMFLTDEVPWTVLGFRTLAEVRQWLVAHGRS